MAHEDCSRQEAAGTGPSEGSVRTYRECRARSSSWTCISVADKQVGIPYITRWILPDKPLPLMMLKEGQAVVYEAGGAEYGKWGLEKMKQIEDEAR